MDLILGAEVIVMCNNIEAQIAEMEAEDDKQMFMEEYKMTEPALNRLIRTTYEFYAGEFKNNLFEGEG